jgi:oligopeptide/dipeptide ABC transporter ATP-binding protein
MTASSNGPLLRVQNLVKHFPIKGGVFGKQKGAVKAVNDVSFEVMPGETLGLVGESGCGKSTTGRLVLRLIEATAGEVTFDGEKVFELAAGDLRRLRRRMQIVFQDPFSSLNPRMTVDAIVREGLTIHNLAEGSAADQRVKQLLEEVGLRPEYAKRFPHEFSGGQRQRIGIARALAVEPKLIVCDEPVSALDVSIQAQILNLLTELKEQFGLTLIFISHNLSVVRHVSDRILVLYLGRMVELAPGDALYDDPKHPYTKALLTAVPVADPKRARQRNIDALQGEIPSPINPPSGCAFRTRCRYAVARCAEILPPLENAGPGRLVACIRWEEIDHAAGMESAAARVQVLKETL